MPDISFEALDFTLWRTQDGGDGRGYLAKQANIGVRPDSDDSVWLPATEAGSSIYDLAVKYGYEGTEAQFVEEYNAAVAAANAAAASASAVEAQVAAAEASRVGAENSRVQAEAERQGAEQTRVNNEAERANNETARTNNEAGRVAAETDRATAENGRQTAEATRQSNETARETQETARQTAETSRQTAETTRGTNENARQTAEAERSSAENTRQSSEASRRTAETAREEQSTSDHQRAENDHSRAEQDHQATANAVLYTHQSLTDSQKAQARTNIGAASQQRLTNNDTINDIVRSLYIPSSEVSAEILATATFVRLYNGFAGLYGVALYDSGNNVVKYIRISSDSAPTDIVGQDGCYADVDFSKVSASYVDYRGVVLDVDTVQSLSAQPGLYATLNSKRIAILAHDETYFKELGVSPIMNYGERPVLYSGDTKAVTNHIVNAVMYPNGVIIAARVGSVVRINLDGTEETLLTIAGASDWRGLFLDKDNNVYASPHASFCSPGGFQMTSRGLYRLAYGQSSFVKVISLYDPNSQNPTEAEQNDDTIWTMCQDRDGYLYAGVYCHTRRYAPRIYRSTDGGITWVDYFDFTTILPNGHHIHSIIFNDYNNALYCIVGEVNSVLKSTDHGTTWTNLGVACEGDKGSSMIAVKDGVIIGSDGAYDCRLSKLYSDDKTVKTVGSFWANTIFAIRKSDVTGWLYAFTKIDSSVNDTVSYMPPIAAITDESALATWIASAPSQLANWQGYHNRVKDYYPDDAIRPQHCGILISKDNGETWEALYYKFVTSNGPSGFVTTGYFRNGECLSGLFENTGNGMAVVNPIIISEGKHKYGANGLALDGEILIRTNTSDNVTPL